MSNRVDFFQSEQRQLAIPGATVSVLLEGALCPYLEVSELVRGDWPEFSWARLAYNPAAYTGAGSTATEEIESKLAIGKTVSIQRIYNGSEADVRIGSFPVFTGQIEGVEAKLDSKGEQVEITVKDFSAEFKRITVYGQWFGRSDGSVLFLAGADTVFNESGKANATAEAVEHEGRSLTLFCAEPSAGKLWSYAEVISYLLCEYLPQGQLHIPGIEQLRALTRNQKVRDLDVTGLNLAEALQRCCERIGLKFKFLPRTVDGQSGQTIVFYRSGHGREVELNCQPAKEQLSISKTNIARLHSRKNFWPVTHKYIGQGDFKVYEATFELVKAWDQADEDSDYDKFSPSMNPDFYHVKDVYRKWCLNEAGDYSGQPYNQGDAFDFSKIFESNDFVQRRRRFRPALSTDRQGKSLGYFLEVSYDNGSSWRQYLHAFNILLDECGVWLSSDQLDNETWAAALAGDLKFRMTASVISDERLSCEVADGPINSTVSVADHVITLPRQFKYRKVSSKSIFADAGNEMLGKPDEVDDSEALYEFIRHTAAASAETIENVDVQTLVVGLDYQVGDRVSSSPGSRDLLSYRSDERSISWLKRVQIDFANQCTNLRIVRQRGQRI